ATTAGLTTLRLATEEIYTRLDETARRVAEVVGSALTHEGVPHVTQFAGNLFSVFFVESADVSVVRDFSAARQQATHRFRASFPAMLDGGGHLPPSPYEAWLVSAAHAERALERMTDVVQAAARAAACAEPEESLPWRPPSST